MARMAQAHFVSTCLRLAALLLAPLPQAGAASEFISDLADIVAPSPADERRALELKAEQFWQAVLTAAEEIKMTQHLEICATAEQVAADLPPENEYARKSLLEAVERLRRADQMVLAHAAQSTELAAGKLAAPGGQVSFSFFSGGQMTFMKQALQRFVAGSSYPELLLEHVSQRQADILPMLRRVSTSTGDILSDTRGASRRSFDLLKYDIYNKGVPKTPQAAKDVAYKLIDAAGETRHKFMRFVTEAVTGISKDFEGRTDHASATVARSAINNAELHGTSSSGVGPVISL